MMDCLLELFFEIFVEGIFELIGYSYIKLMQLIIPNKTISERLRKIIKNTVTVIAVLLIVVLIVGLILFVQDDTAVKTAGKYMTFISLAIIALQIILGIIMKLITLIRK